MWIKNLQQFLLSSKWTLSAADLEDKLAEMPCRPCGPQELRTEGFGEPLKGFNRLVYSAEGLLLITWQEQARLLPGGVVNEMVAEKVDELEAVENRKLARREKNEIKEQIIFEALPRAFTRTRRINVVIDTKDGRVLVDSSSAKQAETVTELLRKALGSLPISRPQTKIAMPTLMTEWLQDPKKTPAGFGIGDRCELRDGNSDGPVVRGTGLNLFGDEVKSHLAAGMLLSKVNLSWQDQLEFDLTDDLSIKRIRPLEQLQEQMDDQDAEDAESALLADLTLQGMNLRKLLNELDTLLTVEAPVSAMAA